MLSESNVFLKVLYSPVVILCFLLSIVDTFRWNTLDLIIFAGIPLGAFFTSSALLCFLRILYPCSSFVLALFSF
jgi:hypothetical protein